MKKTTKLKELFARGKIFTWAGVACALDARVAEMAGCECAAISGAGAAAVVYGLPDAGLITATEMIDNARRIASCVSIPVLCDADQGFGNAINVRRTVQEFIRAGIAGIHIEDQPFPKRCGYVKGKEVISIEEAVGKFRAAVDAKNELDPDFVIIARCDARGTVGGTLEEVIKRLKAYQAAGVDVVFPEALVGREEFKTVRAAVGGPMFTTLGYMDPPPSLEELQELGFCAAVYPSFVHGPGIQASWEYVRDFMARGLAAQLDWAKREWKYPVPPMFMFDLVGFPQVAEAEQKYLPADWLKKYEGSIGSYEPRMDKRR